MARRGQWYTRVTLVMIVVIVALACVVHAADTDATTRTRDTHEIQRRVKTRRALNLPAATLVVDPPAEPIVGGPLADDALIPPATPAVFAPLDPALLIDLHTHTTTSDGTDTTRQLIEKAHEKGIKVIAITDHDQLSYDESAIAYGESLGMTVIRGIELSCEWTFHTSHTAVAATSKRSRAQSSTKSSTLTQAKVHLLGYFTHETPASPLSQLLVGLQQRRRERNAIILAKLKERFGIEITAQQVIDAGSRAQSEKKETDPSTLPNSSEVESSTNDTASRLEYFGRPHIALAVIAAGHASTISEVFERYLSDDRLALDPWSLDLRAAIDAIAAHGGVAVMAHPVTIGLSMESLEEELTYLLDEDKAPLRGIEVYSSKQSSVQSAELLAMSYQLGLVPTGGSDYHGANKDAVDLGQFGIKEVAAAAGRRWGKIHRASLERLTNLRRDKHKTATTTTTVTTAATEHDAPTDTATTEVAETEADTEADTEAEAEADAATEASTDVSADAIEVTTKSDVVEHTDDVPATSPIDIPAPVASSSPVLPSPSADIDVPAPVASSSPVLPSTSPSASSESDSDRPGSLASIVSILMQLAAYGLMVGLLLAGAKLYESPLPLPSPSASPHGLSRAALYGLLVRLVKGNAAMQWLYGSAHTDTPAPKLRSSPPSQMHTISPTSVHQSSSQLLDSSPPQSPGVMLMPISHGRPMSRALHPSSEVPPPVSAPAPSSSSSSPPPLLPWLPVGRSPAQFAFCFIGLQLSYVSWGYLQERIMTVEYGSGGDESTRAHDKFSHSEFLVLLNRIFGGVIAVAVAIVQRVHAERSAARRDSDDATPTHWSVHLRAVLFGVRATPPYKYSLCSISNVLSSWFQYEALKYVSFPLQVLSKSSKILFTMLAGRLVEKKSYPRKEYVMAGLIAAGLMLFRLGEHIAEAHVEQQRSGVDLSALTEYERQLLADAAGAVSSSFLHCLGLLLLLGYIFADSFTSTWQSRIFAQHRVSSVEMMIGVNLFSSIISIIVMVAFGKLLPAIVFALYHPMCLMHAAIMSMCSAIGQLFIFHTISTFGAVPFASMMTARQLLSLVLSIASFGHHVHLVGYAGLAMVFVSLGMKIREDVSKTRARTKTAPTPQARKMAPSETETAHVAVRVNPTASTQ